MSEIDPLELRKSLGWTQAEMAKHLDCHQASVSRMEARGSVSRTFRRDYFDLLEAQARKDGFNRECA